MKRWHLVEDLEFSGQIVAEIETGLPSVTSDDGGQEEFEVEEICGNRKLDYGGREMVVKWRGREKTWEPYENVAEMVALDEYDCLYGTVVVDTVDAA